jgi:hypothetical protein
MRAGRTFPRWLSLGATALVLLQLGGMLHLATAPHGVCWEHGVVVDLDASGGGGDSVAPPEGLASAKAPVVRSDQHPHCPALWVLRQARLGVATTAPILASTRHDAVVSAPEPVPSPRGWTLRRAPKQSPPV